MHRAGEFNQYAVTSNLENSASVTGDQRLQHLLATCLEQGERPCFVALHESAVPDYVGSKYGSEATLHGPAPGAVHLESLGNFSLTRQRSPDQQQCRLIGWSGRAPGPRRHIGWQEAPNERS